jgi:hypothetical protein
LAPSTHPALASGRIALAAAVAAATLPALLAWNVSPSPTFLNQALALALWGAFVAVGAPAAAAAPGRGPWALWAALALSAAAAAWAWGPGALPGSLAWSALGLVAAAALLVAAGAAARRGADAGVALFAAFCWGWLAAGALSALVALVQVFAPALADGELIARSGFPGRAVGNLRQPNHLSTLLLWACIATLALAGLRRLSWRAALAWLVLLVFAVALTGSRTGLVGALLIGAWALADRRLARSGRLLALAVPALFGLAWALLAAWSALAHHALGGVARVGEGDLSSSRFAIWANTLALIRDHPWAGVGFGEFNLAWTLTPFPGRPTAFFDHTHNLPLHLLVELGLPLGGAVLALLAWALWRAFAASWRAEGDAGTASRAALLFVLLVGLHSLLEYPLWYAYFLLPAAWAWGQALGGAAPAPKPEPTTPAAQAPRWPAAAGIVLALAAALAVVDYARVAAIFLAQPGLAPLEQRIESGRRSLLFAHHADYAYVTAGGANGAPAELAAFARTVHYLLDTRLMIAWARALAAAGRLDEARHLAARLREFRKPDAEAFFAPCADAAAPAAAAEAFQCQPPSRPLHWRELLRE